MIPRLLGSPVHGLHWWALISVDRDSATATIVRYEARVTHVGRKIQALRYGSSTASISEEYYQSQRRRGAGGGTAEQRVQQERAQTCVLVPLRAALSHTL